MSLGKIIGRCGASGVVHTGIGRCPKKEGHTVALLVTSRNALYPLKEEEFKSKLSDYVSDTGVLRMHPVNKIVMNEPSGGEVETNEIGFGGPMPIGLSPYQEIYRIEAGDCLHGQISKWNKQDMRVFRVDDQGYIYGTVIQRGDVNYFAGFEAKLYSRKTKGTDRTEVGGIFLGAYYLPNYEEEIKNANAVDVGLMAIPEGLVGVLLEKDASGVKVVAQCSGEDYTSEVEWVAEAFVNSSGVAPESVEPNGGVLKITPAGSYRVQNAAKLQSLDIFGLEGVGDYFTVE